MRQEMRKLNRAKYACSEEEVKRLTAEGYVPVMENAVPDQRDKQDTGPEQSAAAPGKMNGKPVKQPAAGKKNKKPKNPAAAADQNGNGTGQTMTAPDQEDNGAEQPIAVPDQKDNETEQPAASPDPAAADGGGTGND